MIEIDTWEKYKHKNANKKYMYFIIVKWKGKDVFKLGITNNPQRRFCEYRNSETVGYIKEILSIYRCSEPQNLEQIVKWHLKVKKIKPVFKQEYFDIKYKDYILEATFKFVKEFNVKMVECKLSDFILEKLHLKDISPKEITIGDDVFKSINTGKKIYPYYLINKTGDIYNLDKRHFLVKRRSKSKIQQKYIYNAVDLYDRELSKHIGYSIPKLIMYTWGTPPPDNIENPVVGFKDSDRNNTNIENLIWVSLNKVLSDVQPYINRENVRLSTNNMKFSFEDINEVIRLYKSGIRAYEIVKIMKDKLTREVIYRICHNTNKYGGKIKQDCPIFTEKRTEKLTNILKYIINGTKSYNDLPINVKKQCSISTFNRLKSQYERNVINPDLGTSYTNWSKKEFTEDDCEFEEDPIETIYYFYPRPDRGTIDAY